MTEYTFPWIKKEQIYIIWDQISNSRFLFSTHKDSLRWQNLCWRCWHLQRTTLQYIYTPKFYLDDDDDNIDCYLEEQEEKDNDDYKGEINISSSDNGVINNSSTTIEFEKKENRQPCIQPVSLLSQMLKGEIQQSLRRCPTHYSDLSRWFSKQQLVS